MTHNLALGFIKPHASKSTATWDWVRTTLEKQGIGIAAETIVTGPEIREQGLIDRHYTVIARIGGCPDPRTLELNDQAQSAFRNAFGLSWQEAADRNLLFSGMSALAPLKVTPVGLMDLWSRVKAEKIGPGFYAGALGGLYVLNGFYPSIREIYTEDDGLIRCFLMAFNGDSLPWKRFRAEVIGATDPARAPATSIRGALLKRQHEIGLSMSSRDNVIHASASPFEAMLERAIWLPGFNPDADPLIAALAGSGLGHRELMALGRENPILTLNGKTASAIDHLEDTDTPATATLIKGMLRVV